MAKIKGVRNRHMVIMDLLISNPEKDQNEIAAMLGYTPAWLSNTIHSPAFQRRFIEYRRQHESDLSAKMVALKTKAFDVTIEAMEESRSIFRDKSIDVPLRQESIRNILSLKHASAVEKTANVNANVNIPPEIIKSLGSLAEEISQPFTPKRSLKRPIDTVEDEGEPLTIGA
jgi:DNA-binding MarR family transcriptional regulator